MMFLNWGDLLLLEEGGAGALVRWVICVLLSGSLTILVVRLGLWSVVKEVRRLRARLSGIEHALGGTLAEEVNKVAQELYQVNARSGTGEVKA